MNTDEILNSISNSGLKITPQRIAVMEALTSMRVHPTAEEVYNIVKAGQPNISLGTIYKTLDTFVEKGLAQAVKTDGGNMRYDAFTDKHHHIYSTDSGEIEDYYDSELDEIIEKYFKKKAIPGFDIKEIKLQIIGNKIK